VRSRTPEGFANAIFRANELGMDVATNRRGVETPLLDRMEDGP
jgi:hypothetical protein